MAVLCVEGAGVLGEAAKLGWGAAGWESWAPPHRGGLCNGLNPSVQRALPSWKGVWFVSTFDSFSPRQLVADILMART